MDSDTSNKTKDQAPEPIKVQEGKNRSEESNEELVDLDGDGLIGNTGGFYGGTSYIGSNYGEGWNADQTNEEHNEGNLGAAGRQDSSDDREDDTK